MKMKTNVITTARKWTSVCLVLAGVTLAIAVTPQYAAAATQKAANPNVVLMLSDNVGYGDIGAFQGGAIRGQAELNGVLETIYGLHLTIIKVQRAEDDAC